MNDILTLCQDLPELRFGPGADLILQGEADPKLVILKTGAVEILRDGLRVASANTPGSIFGEISVILRTPHSATVRALVPTTCHVIADPDGFLWQNAEIHFELLRLLAQRLVAVNEHLVELSRRSESQDDVIERIVRRIEGSLHSGPSAA